MSLVSGLLSGRESFKQHFYFVQGEKVSMFRIAIVEDEDAFAEDLQNYLLQFQKESGERFLIRRYTDGDEIAEGYSGDHDVILMDIQMRFMDGMTAAEKIRELDREVIIIFITNRADYAIRGYQVDALDYVLKPVNYISFAQKMRRALERLGNRQQEQVVLNTRSGMLRVDTGKIYFVESEGHQLLYHTAIGDHYVRGRMQDAEEMLSGRDFFRINKGSLVNMKHVDGVQDGCCLVHGAKLLISRARRAQFMAALAKYLGVNE